MIRALAVLALVMASACGGPAVRPVPGAAIDRPAYRGARKLVVLLVIDQLPQWAFEAKAPSLAGGFDRVLREGQWMTSRNPTPATLTAPGHALLGTGEMPYRSGIIANEWWDRTENKVINVTNVGGEKNASRLRVKGLGDAVAAANTGAKAVAVSLKHRAAFMLLGHHGTAVYYDDTKAVFASNAPAPWLATFNQQHAVSAHLKDVWTPDPRAVRKSGTVDDQRGETGEKGHGATFPHDNAKTVDPRAGIMAMPVGNTIVLEAAQAALAGEQLGTDASTDLLAISLSAHDLVNHGWGHESWESWDMTLRLDEELGALFAHLDTTVGAGAWALVVTSDHGASPLPERIGGGRLVQPALAQAANNAAATELGAGTWVHVTKHPFLWLTPAFHAKPNPARSKALEKMLRALRSFPGIALADRTATFAGHCDQRTGDAAAICKMIDPERAGEIVILPRRGWVFEDPDEPIATAHGSFHDYDRDVPLILLPFGRTAHERQRAPGGVVDMATIAALVAEWLGVTAPTRLP